MVQGGARSQDGAIIVKIGGLYPKISQCIPWGNRETTTEKVHKFSLDMEEEARRRQQEHITGINWRVV